jgi:GNAT superfamily N-acetyltransferase
MDDATLARLEHENMVEADVLAASQVPDARVERAGGVALVLTGLPLRVFNQVIVEDEDASADAIAAAVAVARDRGDRFVVNLRAGTDDRHLGLLDRLGLVPMPDNPWMPGMALHPLPPPGTAAPVAGHEIRRIVDAAGIEDHVIAAADGFGMPREWLRGIMSHDLLEAPDFTGYVGYTDGRPVTAGLGVRTGRTIGVYNIATIESARRRGHGAAMTMRIVDDGAAAGCDVAVLQASSMGQPIYERLGFRTVVQHMGYVDPSSLEPSGAT